MIFQWWIIIVQKYPCHKYYFFQRFREVSSSLDHYGKKKRQNMHKTSCSLISYITFMSSTTSVEITQRKPDTSSNRKPNHYCLLTPSKCKQKNNQTTWVTYDSQWLRSHSPQSNHKNSYKSTVVKYLTLNFWWNRKPSKTFTSLHPTSQKNSTS